MGEGSGIVRSRGARPLHSRELIEWRKMFHGEYPASSAEPSQHVRIMRQLRK